jgi:hypothetical protein
MLNIVCLIKVKYYEDKALSAYKDRTSQYYQVKNVNKGVDLEDLMQHTIRLNFDVGENIIVDDDGEVREEDF